MEGDWTGRWGHEYSVGELFLRERGGRWQKEPVAEHGLGPVRWCCGAGAAGEHAARGGKGCRSGGCQLEGLWLWARRMHWVHIDILVHGFRLRSNRSRQGLASLYFQRLQIVLHALIVLVGHRLREPPVLLLLILLLLLRWSLVSLLALRFALQRLFLPTRRQPMSGLETHNFRTLRIPDDISVPRSSRQGHRFREPSSLFPLHARRTFVNRVGVFGLRDVVLAVLFEHVFLRFHAFAVLCCSQIFARHGDFVRVI